MNCTKLVCSQYGRIQRKKILIQLTPEVSMYCHMKGSVEWLVTLKLRVIAPAGVLVSWWFFFPVIFVLIIPFILRHLLFLTINDVDDGDE